MNVLISGGTGTFGHAMTRWLLENKMSDRVCIYSRDEKRQAEMREAFNDDKRLRFFLGCVRERDRFRRAVRHADVVFHAAAMKRIEACYYNPTEAVLTNVYGTQVVAHTCEAVGVRCVLLSTDKACEPISNYGYTKALAESVALNAGAVVVRYGNVWASNGSVVPRWLASGDTVTVTDPDCTRFMMTADEAVEFVWSASEKISPEIQVPDLPAYRLGDLAGAMGKQMNVVGLPHWEKKHESMLPGQSSDKARRMTMAELVEALKHL